jgi:ATP-binding cassette, subfamily C (CFTR/MRP), member 1
MSNPDSETAKLISGHVSSSTTGRSGSATPRSPSELTRVSTPKSTHIGLAGEKGFEEILREKLASSTLTLNKSVLLTSGKVPKEGSAVAPNRKEHSEQGKVKRYVYIEYARAASVWGFFLFFLSILGNQASSIAGSYSLRAWGKI